MTKTIVADGIAKQFNIGSTARSGTLAAKIQGMIRGGSHSRGERFWALDDVSFSVDEGEIFGIVGRNGSGKSTLLKILTGITRPTRGTAAIRGRIGALLEVGTGFHPDLSGRENVYFNGALLGMSRSDIDRKFDEIVAFAGVEQFVDTQIKHYSSGMQARLGFAVAAHLQPEVLIVDEVLSVGDLVFQEKSVSRMSDLRKAGITALFVSHNLNSVSEICARSMLLDHGRVKMIGPTSEVLMAYIPRMEGRKGSVDYGEGSAHEACLLSAALERDDGGPADDFDINEDIWLRVRYAVKNAAPGLQLGVVVNSGPLDITHTFDTDAHVLLGVHAKGVFEKRARIRRMFLKEGDYQIDLHCGVPSELYDYYHGALSFTVSARTMKTDQKSFRRDRVGKVIFQGEWHDA